MCKHNDFDNFSEMDWIYYHEALNKELPPDQCEVKLTDGEKEAYLRALKYLQDERKKILVFPSVTIQIFG